MRVSAKIMAHPSRKKFIPSLLEKTGLTNDDVIWDRKNDRWDTGRRAWEAIDRTADYGLVIQDDALPCRDLIPGLEKALTYVNEPAILSLYIGTRRPYYQKIEQAAKEAVRGDARWIKMHGLNWGVAIVMPTNIIDEALAWGDKQNFPQYDRRLARYVIDVLGLPAWCPWPSLVDHRDTPSLVGHGTGRHAFKFIGADKSAVDVDWNGHIIDMKQPNFGRRGYTARNNTPRTRQPIGGKQPATQLRVPKQQRFEGAHQ